MAAWLILVGVLAPLAWVLQVLDGRLAQPAPHGTRASLETERGQRPV